MQSTPLDRGVIRRFHDEKQRDGSSKCKTVMSRLFSPKSIDDIMQGHSRDSLRRHLRAIDLTLLGIGEIIGSGIFIMVS